MNAGACTSEEQGGTSAQPERPVYNVYNQVIDTRNNMPATANQLPWPGQKVALSTDRAVSNIPKGGTQGTWVFPSPQMFYNALMRKGKGDDVTENDMESVVSVHNGASCCSERHLSTSGPPRGVQCCRFHCQSASAGADPGPLDLTVAPQPTEGPGPIRAAPGMNEMTWRQVSRWESLHTGAVGAPKLVRFLGRPDDLSPRARVRSWFGGAPRSRPSFRYTRRRSRPPPSCLSNHPLPDMVPQMLCPAQIKSAPAWTFLDKLPPLNPPGPLPFDRHDWYIDRNGEEVRYVIDFYFDENKAQSMDAFSVDVRPAMDGVTSLHDRAKMGVRERKEIRTLPADSLCLSSVACGSAVSGAKDCGETVAFEKCNGVTLSADLRVVCTLRAAVPDHWVVAGAAHEGNAGSGVRIGAAMHDGAAMPYVLRGLISSKAGALLPAAVVGGRRRVGQQRRLAHPGREAHPSVSSSSRRVLAGGVGFNTTNDDACLRWLLTTW